MIRSCFSLLWVVCSGSVLLGDDLWLAADGEFPGRIRISEGGTEPRVYFSRADRPNAAFPNAKMKVSQIAIGVQGEVYYCSGLDGSLMTLLGGQHEIQAGEVNEQVRDLACTSEEHTVYFSTVSTPQNSEPLSDGVIYRRDFWEGTHQQVAKVKQSEVGGNWWGIFTIRNDEIYLATNDSPSRLYRWAGGRLERVFEQCSFHVVGLTVSSDNRFMFADGSGDVWETNDFRDAVPVLRSRFPLKDVATRTPSSTVRP